MLLDGLLEAVLRGTREFVDLLAVLEVHESGNTSHTLDVGKGIELINIHMDEDYILFLKRKRKKKQRIVRIDYAGETSHPNKKAQGKKNNHTGYFAAMDSKMGANMRQGGHQEAEKSAMT
jgi:hypothetical protein